MATPPPLTHREQVVRLHAEVARFHAAVVDLDAPVPACPGWRVRDLVHHVGSVHRMFRRVAAEGWTTRPAPPDPDDRPTVEDDRVAEWAREQAAGLLQALEALDPAAPRWNFTTGPQVGAFIPRRMLHETTIHRWDAEGAQGSDARIEVEVARDGVREYLEVLRLRWGPWGGRPATVRIEVAGGPTIELVLRPDEEPDVQVDAPAEDPGPQPDVQVDAGLQGSQPASGDVAVIRADPVAAYLAWWGRRSLVELGRDRDAALLTQVRDYART